MNSKQDLAIKQYLASRFGGYGINTYELNATLSKVPNYTCVEYEQVLSKKYLGIFSHALKSCLFQATAWIPQGKLDNPCLDASVLVSCRLSYAHLGGGSNGCALAVRFAVKETGEITELYN